MATVIATNVASGRTYSLNMPEVPEERREAVMRALAPISGSRWLFGLRITGPVPPRNGMATKVFHYQYGPSRLGRALYPR